VAPPDHTLLDVLDGCKQGSAESQKALYDRFYGYSMAICMRYSRNHDDALEIMNDGFMKIFRNLPRFVYPPEEARLISSFTSWLKKIMVYTAIDYHRAARHDRHQDISEEAWHLPYDNSHPLDNLTYEELMRLVQQLSPAYRAVFNLFVIDGYSHEEIATILDIAVGTSKSNLSKAREHLRHLLKKTHEEVVARYER
jgi:RNA polymerase sigma-70 factor (ECF subfamily)